MAIRTGPSIRSLEETFARSEQLDKAGVMLGDAGEATQKVVDSCADLILRRCQRNLLT